MGVGKIVRKGVLGIKNHGNTILTVLGCGGVVSTAIFAIGDTKEAERRKEDLPPNTSKKEELRRVLPAYIPTLLSGTLTIAMIIGSHKISMRKNAILTSLYSASELALSEYKEQVKAAIGEKKEREIQDDIERRRVETHPYDNSKVIETGFGHTLFFDDYTGRYFRSDINKVKAIANNCNRRIINEMWISANDFYIENNLPSAKFCDSVGFNVDRFLEIVDPMRSYTTSDGEVVVVLQFVEDPVPYNYHAHG